MKVERPEQSRVLAATSRGEFYHRIITGVVTAAAVSALGMLVTMRDTINIIQSVDVLAMRADVNRLAQEHAAMNLFAMRDTLNKLNQIHDREWPTEMNRLAFEMAQLKMQIDTNEADIMRLEDELRRSR